MIRYDHGTFTTFHPGAALPDALTNRIDSDESGATWVFTTAGTSRFANEKLPIQGRSGYLSLTDHHGDAGRWKDGVRYPLGGYKSPFLLNVIERNDGSFWLATLQTSLSLLRPRLVRTIATIGSPEVGAVLYQQRNGTVWAAGDAVSRYLGSPTFVAIQRMEQGRLQTYTARTHVRSQNYRNTLREDAEGHLLLTISNPVWLKKKRGGEMQLAKPYPSIADNVDQVFLDNHHQQWFATDKGLLLSRPGTLPATATLSWNKIRASADPGRPHCGDAGKRPMAFRTCDPRWMLTAPAQSVDRHRKRRPGTLPRSSVLRVRSARRSAYRQHRHCAGRR